MLALIEEDIVSARLIHFNEEFQFHGDTEGSISRLHGQWAGPVTVPTFTVVEDVDEIQGPGAVDVPVR